MLINIEKMHICRCYIPKDATRTIIKGVFVLLNPMGNFPKTTMSSTKMLYTITFLLKKDSNGFDATTESKIHCLIQRRII